MRTIRFTADTIDGKIQIPAQHFQLRCDKIKPIGVDIVRQYNGNECIQSMKVFLVLYGGQLLGNREYKSFEGFMSSLRAFCFTDYMLVNDCILTLNGCEVTV